MIFMIIAMNKTRQVGHSGHHLTMKQHESKFKIENICIGECNGRREKER